MGLGLKVTLVISLLITAALLVVCFISSQTASSSLETTEKSALKSSATDNANLLAEKIGSYKNDVELTASRTRVQSMDWSQQQAVLAQDAKTYGFERMGAAKPDGSLNYSNGTTANVSDRDYFKQALTGKTAISDPLIAKTTGKLTLYIASPIYNSSKEIIGVTVAALDNTFLSNMIKDVKGSASGYAFILNSQGTVIGHKKQSEVTSQSNVFEKLKKDKSLSELAAIVTKMDKGETGYGEYTYKDPNTGEIRISDIAYTRIPDTTWSIGVIAAKKDIMAPVTSLQTTIYTVAVIFLLIAIVISFLLITVMITRPLKKTVKMIQDLAQGRLSTRLKIKSRDEVGRMSEAMNALADDLQLNVVGTMNKISVGDMSVDVRMRGSDDELMPALDRMTKTVRAITADTQKIIAEAQNGNLNERCNTKGYNGSWKELADGINALMDAVSAPIDELRDVLERISGNDYTTGMIGEYKGIFKQMADEANSVRDHLLGVQDTIERISLGDTEKLEEIKEHGKRSENDRLVPAIIRMMETINDLIAEVGYLSEESVKGNVHVVRGDYEKFEGGFRETILGFNKTLDAISAPISELEKILHAVALNDYTSSIDTNLPGSYGELMGSVNNVQNSLLDMQNIAVDISNGKINRLEEFRAIGRRCENDHIVPALTLMMESIQSVIDETTVIARSAAEGNLKSRGDAEKFSGGYRQIIEGINGFLEAVERPTNEIKRVLVDMSNAKFDVHIEGEYQGDFKLLTDSVNSLANSLNNIVTELSDTMTTIADGDFGIERIRDYRGDFFAVSQAMNTILDRFNELISNIYITAEQVSSGANQVSDGSQSLSQGAAEQASTVEEFSATITQLSAQTRDSALNAAETDKLVSQVKENAAEGRNKMSSMMTSMEEINQASVSISKVIKVIDDLAFQTNILALNAAVEAARAGQYGKGFAVVAEEVRTLASRSATAAKETAELIESTIQKIKGGTALADQSAESFANIAEGVNRVSELVSKIASASNEQANGITQIDSGVSVISNVVQTNSATAEESAAASEELSGQAEMLREQVAQFRLRKSDLSLSDTSRPLPIA